MWAASMAGTGLVLPYGGWWQPLTLGAKNGLNLSGFATHTVVVTECICRLAGCVNNSFVLLLDLLPGLVWLF